MARTKRTYRPIKTRAKSAAKRHLNRTTRHLSRAIMRRMVVFTGVVADA